MTDATAARLGLVGAECTGKSVLAAHLATELGAAVVPERLRHFVQEHGRAPRADEQRAIMSGQRDDIDEAALASAIVIADPMPLMTAAYSIAYFDDYGLLEAGLAQAHEYLLVAWCRPDIPWVPDAGMRDGPGWRSRVDAILAGDVIAALRDCTAVVEAPGPLDFRLATVRQAWQRLAGDAPT